MSMTIIIVFLCLGPILVHVYHIFFRSPGAKELSMRWNLADLESFASHTRSRVQRLSESSSSQFFPHDGLCTVCVGSGRIQTVDSGPVYLRNCTAIYAEVTDQIVALNRLSQDQEASYVPELLVLSIIVAFEGHPGSSETHADIDNFLTFIVENLMDRLEYLNTVIDIELVLHREYYLNWSVLSRNTTFGASFIEVAEFEDGALLEFDAVSFERGCDSKLSCREEYVVLYIPSTASDNMTDDSEIFPPALLFTNSEDDNNRLKSLFGDCDWASKSHDESYAMLSQIVRDSAFVVTVNKDIHVLVINAQFREFQKLDWRVSFASTIIHSIGDIVKSKFFISGREACKTCAMQPYSDCFNASSGCALFTGACQGISGQKPTGLDEVNDVYVVSRDEVSIILPVFDYPVESWELHPLQVVLIEKCYSKLVKNLEIIHAFLNSSTNYQFSLTETLMQSFLEVKRVHDTEVIQFAADTPLIILKELRLLLAISEQLLQGSISSIDFDLPFDQRLAIIAPFWVPLLVPIAKGLLALRTGT